MRRWHRKPVVCTGVGSDGVVGLVSLGSGEEEGDVLEGEDGEGNGDDEADEDE